MNPIIRRTITLTAAILSLWCGAAAQNTSSSTGVLRRGNAGEGRTAPGKRADAPESTAPQVTERLQNRLESTGVSDADRQWMRVIYRKLDLDKSANTPLYYPVDLVDGNENLIRIIFRLFAAGQLPAYEFLDGREIFADKYLAKPDETLTRFGIPFTNGGSARQPVLEVDEYDVPSESVKSYYIIERWEYDTRNNKLHNVIEAICPVWQRLGDDGMTMPTPLFWIKYEDLRPHLTTQAIFLSDDNNLPTCTIDDFFSLNLYDGEIYKTRNLRNLTMNQIYGSDEAVAQAQDSIQRVLDNFGDKLWVPSLAELQAAAEAKAAVTDQPADSAAVAAAPAVPTRAPRTTRTPRTKPAAKVKTKKPKTTTPKSSGNSNAARSVRNRRR